MKTPTRRLMLPLVPILALALSACGFEPLYSQHTEAKVNPLLAQIKVSPIRDRIGQMLEWQLRESLNPDGTPATTRYVLNVQLQVTRNDLGVQRDTSALRGQVTTQANFTLTDPKAKTVLYRSRSQTIGSYDVTDDGYAAQVAFEDAQKRAVREIADDIHTRLVLFLRDRPG